MTKITVDKDLIEQAVEAAFSPYCAQDLASLVPALRASLAEPAQTTCNCRWEGGTQVQQCTLHEAHIEAIHEWAERAKTAEKKLAQPVVKDCLTTEPAVESVAEVYQRTTGGNSFPGTGIRWLDGVGLIPTGTKLYASPPPPAEVPLLTTDEYTTLAHRIASKYAHRSDPQHIAYTFLPHTLEQFVRAVEQATRRKVGLA